LAEANGVLALWDTIINFEVVLGDALRETVSAVMDKGLRGGDALFEESTSRCRGSQHPGDEAARPESQRQREERRGRKRQFQ